MANAELHAQYDCVIDLFDSLTSGQQKVVLHLMQRMAEENLKDAMSERDNVFQIDGSPHLPAS